MKKDGLLKTNLFDEVLIGSKGNIKKEFQKLTLHNLGYNKNNSIDNRELFLLIYIIFMKAKFTEISDKHFVANVELITPSNGKSFKIDQKTGLAIPKGLKDMSVEQEVGESKTKIDQVIKNDPIEKLKQSNHPRAKALIKWIRRDEINEKWYLENVGTKFDLVEDGIMILGNIWKLEDEKMEKKSMELIRNNFGHTYFSFSTQNKLFGEIVYQKKMILLI